MGLFGGLDATEVADDPFYVAPDKYQCILTEANRVEKKDGSGEGLSFKWVIDDEDSEFYQNSVSDWFNIYPEASELTPDIKKANARLKQRLIQMGLSNAQMDVLLDDDNLDELIGMTAYVDIVESTDKNDPDKKYINVRRVTRLEDE